MKSSIRLLAEQKEPVIPEINPMPGTPEPTIYPPEVNPAEKPADPYFPQPETPVREDQPETDPEKEFPKEESLLTKRNH